MPRLMSVAYTEDQVHARTKRVTRRAGWRHAVPGMRLTLVRKAMGLKKGERVVKVAEVVVVDARREPLQALLDDPVYGAAEMELEGFPGMDPAEFIHTYFTRTQSIRPEHEVTRIQYRYIEETDHA